MKLLLAALVAAVACSGEQEHFRWKDVTHGESLGFDTSHHRRLSIHKELSEFVRRKPSASVRVFELLHSKIKPAAADAKTHLFDVQAHDLEDGSHVKLPLCTGGETTFQLQNSGIIPKALQDRHPDVRSFHAFSLEDHSVTADVTVSSHGLRAQIFTSSGKLCYIDPYSVGRSDLYTSYAYGDSRTPQEDKALRKAAKRVLKQAAQQKKKAAALPDKKKLNKRKLQQEVFAPENLPEGDVSLTTYKMGLAATPSYVKFAADKGGAMSLVTATLTRAMGIWRRELGVSMELIPDNDKLFTFQDSDASFDNDNALLDNSQDTFSKKVDTSTLDIGHWFQVLESGSAGMGGLGPCTDYKYNGITGTSNPIGDSFDVDFVAHEMAHQFGLDHTWVGNGGGCTQSNFASGMAGMELGSGNTLVSYAGVCGDQDLADATSPYFHVYSLHQFSKFMKDPMFSSCGKKTSTTNKRPSVTVPTTCTVPKLTAFQLTGSGTDPDGDQLKFNWEQTDYSTSQVSLEVESMNGPLFVTVEPSSTGSTRSFPSLDNVRKAANAGQPLNTFSKAERAPSTSRTLHFALTARDKYDRDGKNGNNVLGAWHSAITTVKVANLGPLSITSPGRGTTLKTGKNLIVFSLSGSATEESDRAVASASYKVEVAYCNPDSSGSSLSQCNSWTTLAPGVKLNAQNQGSIEADLKESQRVVIRVSASFNGDASSCNFFAVSSEFTVSSSGSTAGVAPLTPTVAPAGAPTASSGIPDWILEQMQGGQQNSSPIAPTVTPTGAPVTPKGCVCDNTCEYANDGFCDDGLAGDDFQSQMCAPGTDCADCGASDRKLFKSKPSCDAGAETGKAGENIFENIFGDGITYDNDSNQQPTESSEDWQSYFDGYAGTGSEYGYDDSASMNLIDDWDAVATKGPKLKGWEIMESPFSIVLTFDKDIHAGSGSIHVHSKDNPANVWCKFSADVESEVRVLTEPEGCTLCQHKASISLETCHLAQHEAYTMSVASGCFKGQESAASFSARNFNFKTKADFDPPYIIKTAPAADSVGNAEDSYVRITFSEPLIRGSSGNLTLTRNDAEGDVEVETVDVSNVLVGDDFVQYTPSKILDPLSRYTVHVTEGLVRDVATNAAIPFHFSFVTGDFHGPKLMSVHIQKENQFLMVFNEPVKIVGKSIYLQSASSRSIVNFRVNDKDQVSVNGKLITITSIKPIPPGAYYVRINDKALADMSNNAISEIVGTDFKLVFQGDDKLKCDPLVHLAKIVECKKARLVCVITQSGTPTCESVSASAAKPTSTEVPEPVVAVGAAPAAPVPVVSLSSSNVQMGQFVPKPASFSAAAGQSCIGRCGSTAAVYPSSTATLNMGFWSAPSYSFAGRAPSYSYAAPSYNPNPAPFPLPLATNNQPNWSTLMANVFNSPGVQAGSAPGTTFLNPVTEPDSVRKQAPMSFWSQWNLPQAQPFYLPAFQATASSFPTTTSSVRVCYCDDKCSDHNDCCPDYKTACNANIRPISSPLIKSGSCRGRCGSPPVAPFNTCYCDAACSLSSDCCADYQQQCL